MEMRAAMEKCMITDLEILRSLRELISDKEKWCRGTFARDENKNSVSPMESTACAWCIVGGIDKIANDNSVSGDGVLERIDLYSLEKQAKNIDHFNDTSSHAEVLKLLDDYIKEIDNG